MLNRAKLADSRSRCGCEAAVLHADELIFSHDVSNVVAVNPPAADRAYELNNRTKE